MLSKGKTMATLRAREIKSEKKVDEENFTKLGLDLLLKERGL